MSKEPPQAEQRPWSTTHHDITVSDPFHWLKDPAYPEVTDPAILEYLEQENAYFESVMGRHEALTDSIFEEIKGRIKEDDEAVPWQEGDYLYSWHFEKGSEYRIWTRKPAGGGEWQTILDEPAEAQGQDYYRVADIAVSPDGKLMAWSTDTSGGERYTIRVKNLDSGELLDDVVEEAHGAIAWDAHGGGFFYDRVNKEWRPDKVFYHALGGEDALIYQEHDTSFFVRIHDTRSRQWLVVATGDHVTSEVRVVPLSNPLSPPRLIAPRRSGHEYHLDHAEDKFVICTNDAHKNFRLVTAPVDAPNEENWTELLPGSDEHYYRGHACFRDFLAVQERIDGLDHIRIRSWGGDEHFIVFPEPVYSTSIGNNPEFDQSHLRLGYSSMVTPASTFDYHTGSNKLELRKQQEIPSGYDRAAYVTERLMAPARDGARIPLTLVYRKDFPPDGSRPLHLYGYGAYGVGMSPSFSAARLSLLDRGFTWAIAHVRGGDEMGYQWYEDGKLRRRWNTFNDFIDAATWLIETGYAKAGNLSASGGSAGGELIGAAIVQAPELWRAMILDVPFVDVLNTMLDDGLPLTPIEWPEWGNPIESKEDFLYIQSYSPYDHIEARDYPMQLVTGGLNDPRVTYWEPAKWTAKMRSMKTDRNLLLMKINMGAGHGGKSGRYQQIRETAESWTFLLLAFGLAGEG